MYVSPITTNVITNFVGSPVYIDPITNNIITNFAQPSNLTIPIPMSILKVNQLTDLTDSVIVETANIVVKDTSGYITSTTPPTLDNSTKVATTAFVNGVSGGYTAGVGLTLSGKQFSLPNTAVTAGTYGSASTTVSFTVDVNGRLTSASQAAIAITHTQVSGLGSAATRNAGTLTGNVLLLAEDNKLPVLNGSNLTNLPTPSSGFTNIVAVTTSGTWAIPAGVTKLKVTVVGGGGGGGNGYSACGSTSIGGGGGGGGGVGISYLNSLTPGNNFNIVIGSGGASNLYGSNTTFSSGTQTTTTITSSGGGNGDTQWSSGEGGSASGANINLRGNSGGAGSWYSQPVNGIGGNGGGAAGFGGGGRSIVGSPGTAGSSYGAGGSGGANGTNSAGGVGYQGAVIIEY